MTVISGFGVEPTPSSSLISWWCAAEIAPVDDLLWLAAVGLIGDLGEKAPFDELGEARARYGATALKAAVALVNAPRRASRSDATPALRALMAGDSPKAIAAGTGEGAAEMIAARAEVKSEMERAARPAAVRRRRRAVAPAFGLPDPPTHRTVLAQSVARQDRYRRQQWLSPGLGSFRCAFRDWTQPCRLPRRTCAGRGRRSVRSGPRAGDRRRAAARSVA